MVDCLLVLMYMYVMLKGVLLCVFYDLRASLNNIFMMRVCAAEEDGCNE